MKKIKLNTDNSKTHHGLNFIVFISTLSLLLTIIHFLPNILKKQTSLVNLNVGYVVSDDYSIKQKVKPGVSNDEEGYARLLKPTDSLSYIMSRSYQYGFNHGKIAGDYFRETLLDNKITYKVIKNTYNCYAYTISGEKTPEVIWTVIVNINGGVNNESCFVLKEGSYNGK